jgi:predicted metalloendopeptidase
MAEPRPLSSGVELLTFDRAVRPQDDLYRYVNGRWLATAKIPEDRVSYGTFMELADQVELDTREVIEDAAAGRVRLPDAKRVVDLYQSLMDEARIERLGVAPIGPQLSRFDAIATRREFAAEAGRLASIGAGGLFAASVEADARDQRSLAVRLSQGGTLLPDRANYLDHSAAAMTMRAQYREYLVRIFQLTGRRTPEADADAVLALETALAKAQSPNTYARDAIQEPQRFTLNRLSHEMPGFDWWAWARPQGIDRAAAIVFEHPTFFRGFAALAGSEPLDAWKAWLAVRYITASAPFLDQAVSDARFEFFGRQLTGQQEPRTRWKRGVGLVNTFLGDAVGRLYVAKRFPPEAKPRVRSIVDHIVKAYRTTIDHAAGIAPEAKRTALTRLDSITTGIGAPDTWRSYGGLTIKPDDLIGNVQRAQRWESDQRLRRLRGPRDRGEWLITPQTVNAYYAPSLNQIVLPAAMLQPPLFRLDAEDAVNYGGIGAIIAHEIAHGLEDVASFDAASPLVAQFNAYTPVDGVHLNGRLTLRENSADLAGLSIAWQAYHLSLGGRAAPILDGFTGDQRFFINWARVWRSLEHPDYVRQYLPSNPYPPFEYRANGIISNIPAFYEAFDVRPGDRLYREAARRARIW